MNSSEAMSITIVLWLCCTCSPCDKPKSCTAQGILIAILVGTGVIDNAEDGSNLQNLMVCLEMLPAAIGMFYAFPYTEYKDGGARHIAHCAALSLGHSHAALAVSDSQVYG